MCSKVEVENQINQSKEGHKKAKSFRLNLFIVNYLLPFFTSFFLVIASGTITYKVTSMWFENNSNGQNQSHNVEEMPSFPQYLGLMIDNIRGSLVIKSE